MPKQNVSRKGSFAKDEWTTVSEQIIHADVHGLYQDDILKSSVSQGWVQLIGLDTEEPILQVGRQTFAGTFSDSADTSVFFRCEPSSSGSEAEADKVFSHAPPRLSASYQCKTKKKLSFKRVFLQPKNLQ
jgi:hypothetical protein